ncbi:cytochrome P450 [Nocardioides sp. zg-536]|uniref:Cytochrome P450 n=1 Tax=Nocardioides faecalis TaxID=2803858 RepID=A0A939BXV0_9ACTN|nr:cytochrome P450 [Nocardioides faecalis]MBM9459673.1 cytochrome P450 [Nocardioides faecalis]MBS4753550.1 cytochrome P450 [Nocardioides faecalis]QVI58193.1 cytochrome P450 [Nocardioides faecalis]
MSTDQAVRPLPDLVSGDRGWPLLGRGLDYARDPVALMQHQWDTYGPVSPLPFLGKTYVMLLGPDAVGDALRNADKAFVNEPAWGAMVGPFFNRGLMLLDGSEHHGHRRIMQEAFTRDRLTRYAELMHPSIARGLARWPAQEGFACYPALKQLTLDVAADIFMGGAADTTPGEMDRVNRAFIACVQAAAGVVRADVPFTRWGRAYRGRRVLEDFLRHYLPAKRADPGDDLFSVLCHIEDADGDRFSDDDVVNHMIFLMMAAHDTSTITTSTMLQLLGQHPEWQERCREESMALGDAPGLAELEGLTSLDMVMKEALRLRAPVPAMARQTVKETVVQGVRLPAGTPLAVGVQFNHLMPELWSDPTRFDPERFGPERREDKSHRYAWAPFGGGVHKCIGLHFAGAEVKTILHHLLRTRRWHVDPSYVAPLDNHSLPYPKDGQPIDIAPL